VAVNTKSRSFRKSCIRDPNSHFLVHTFEFFSPVQAAYVRQFLEQVNRTQAHLGAGVPAAVDSAKKMELDPGDEGKKRLKMEDGWVTTSVKPDAQPEVLAALQIPSCLSCSWDMSYLCHLSQQVGHHAN
jgi:hypothetical protein